MLAKDRRQMLAEALRIGHARGAVIFPNQRHTDTLSSGWFHGSDSPYGAVCSIHSIGLEVESSYCLHRFSTNHEIRWNQKLSTLEPIVAFVFGHPPSSARHSPSSAAPSQRLAAQTGEVAPAPYGVHLPQD